MPIKYRNSPARYVLTGTFPAFAQAPWDSDIHNAAVLSKAA